MTIARAFDYRPFVRRPGPAFTSLYLILPTYLPMVITAESGEAFEILGWIVDPFRSITPSVSVLPSHEEKSMHSKVDVGHHSSRDSFLLRIEMRRTDRTSASWAPHYSPSSCPCPSRWLNSEISGQISACPRSHGDVGGCFLQPTVLQFTTQSPKDHCV